MARRKRDKSMSTKRTISVKVSEYEYWLLTHLAKQVGLSTSQLGRKCLMNWVTYRYWDKYEELRDQHQKEHQSNGVQSN